MNFISAWQNALGTAWLSVWSTFSSFVPSLLGAIVVFVIGLIIAYWVKRIMVEFLKVMQVDEFARSGGIDKYFKKADIKFTLSELLATIFEWLVLLTFFLAVVDILGLTSVSRVLLSVVSYIPNVIAAIFIFAAGYIIAKIADGVVRSALSSVDHDVAKPLGKAARWTVILIALFSAIDQLKVADALVNTFFQGLTYTIVLALGLSIGLGAKDLVSRILTDWYEKINK